MNEMIDSLMRGRVENLELFLEDKDMRKSGFTLIELLIVVAIIAILAAIAVPNFLEAQVRAKITRVKSDQRSLATAIESYVVDYNSVIGTQDMGNLFPSLSGDEATMQAYARLTTPVAYTTNIPRDPFQVGSDLDEVRVESVFKYQSSNSWSTGSWRHPRKRGYVWGLNSMGPRLRNDGGFRSTIRGVVSAELDHRFNIYDSTNGTKSHGFIIRTNKGIMDAPDLLPEV